MTVLRYTRSMRLLIALVVAAVLLAGCTDSESGGGTGEAARQPTTTISARAGESSTGTTAPTSGTGNAAVQRPAQAYDPSAFTLEVEPVLSGLRSPVFV